MGSTSSNVLSPWEVPFSAFSVLHLLIIFIDLLIYLIFIYWFLLVWPHFFLLRPCYTQPVTINNQYWQSYFQSKATDRSLRCPQIIMGNSFTKYFTIMWLCHHLSDSDISFLITCYPNTHLISHISSFQILTPLQITNFYINISYCNK